MTGKQVTVTSDHLALQNGKATIQFNTATAAAGGDRDLQRHRHEAARRDADLGQGHQHLDLGRQATARAGRCRTAPTRSRWPERTPAAPSRPLPFSVVGTATGVQSQSNGMQLQMGALSVDFSKVQSVGN